MRFLYRFPFFRHADLHVFTHAVLLNDFSAVMGNHAPDLVELARFDDEFKRFARRQNSET
jgi:hypothetical protein